MKNALVLFDLDDIDMSALQFFGNHPDALAAAKKLLNEKAPDMTFSDSIKEAEFLQLFITLLIAKGGAKKALFKRGLL